MQHDPIASRRAPDPSPTVAADEEQEQLAYLPQLDADGNPYVVFQWGDKTGFFATDAARRAALALLEAAEQADLEHAMWTWLLNDTDNRGSLDERKTRVARIIATFRSHRAAGDEERAPFTPGEGVHP